MRVFLLDDYLIECEVRGLAAVTIRGYRNQLSYYLKHYDLTQEGVNQFILDSKKKGLHTSTINSYLIAIRAFCKWANVDIKIRLLKKEEIIKEIYTCDDIQRLIRKPKTKNFNQIKIWALICFLVGTGCRLGTALEVKVEDIDFESGYVILRHMKNRKQQLYPLTKGLLLVLRQYVVIRGNTGYLFCNQYGKKADFRTTQKQIADYNHAHGVNKTSAHLFRRTFAANYIRSGGDIYRLSRLLNHSTMEMSAYYARIYGADLKYNLEELSLLDINQREKIKIN